jgi:hypothetical protein
MASPTNEPTETIRVALELACKELSLSETDDVSSERVASAIRTLAECGQEDAGQLKTYAVYRFRTLGC